jgi:acetylornithine deacetylase
VRLLAEGRAAHSAVPERGVSAIDKLLDALVRLRRIDLPSDPVLGTTYYSIGLIEGGVAPNVVSPHASAELMFRTVGDAGDVLHALEAVEPLVRIEEVLRVPAVRLKTVPGLPSEVFPFTTDIPFLDRWGEPMLFGPGSILVAHTAEEHVQLEELYGAVDTYVRLARFCLAEAEGRSSAG